MDRSLIFFGFNHIMTFKGVGLKSASSLLEVIIDEVTEEIEMRMSSTPLSSCGYLVPIEIGIHEVPGEKRTAAIITYVYCCNSDEDFRKLKLMFSENSTNKLKEYIGTDNACHYNNINYEYLNQHFVSDDVIKVVYGAQLKIKDSEYKRYYNIKTKKAAKTLAEVKESL